MKILPRSLFLWWGVTGLCALPALSNAGYTAWSLEYLLVALSLGAVAIACWLLACKRWLGIPLLWMFTGFSILLYMGPFLSNIYAGPMIGLFALTVMVLSLRNFNHALLLSGVTAWAQIATTTAATPGTIARLETQPVAQRDAPSVIHILLDEHTGLAHIPPEAVPPMQVKAFIDAYVRQGFMVFTHAYTLDRDTNYSVARILNTDLAQPPRVLRMGEGKREWWVSRSTSFDRIGEQRNIDATYTGFVNLRPVLSKNPAVARSTQFDENILGSTSAHLGLSVAARLRLAGHTALDWLYFSLQPPIIFRFTATELGQRVVKENMRSRVHPLVSYRVLNDFIDRLDCCGERGNYYFAHVIFPHVPMMFGAQCDLRPMNEWQSYALKGTLEEKLQMRTARYRDHFLQASCSAKMVQGMVEALAKRPQTADAVVLVHSDHGSRIALKGLKEYSEAYTHKNYEQDMRASFIALKIPGMEGRVVDTPVRLDDLYANLLKNNFTTLELDQLKVRGASPY